MIYEGKAITVKALESGIVELKFDLKGESVNKFNRLTLNELRQAVDSHQGRRFDQGRDRQQRQGRVHRRRRHHRVRR